MLNDFLYSSPADVLLGKMLDRSALYQRVIAANVANVGTPGYRRLGVSFDEKLRNAMSAGGGKLKRTNPLHLPDPNTMRNIKPEVVQIENGYWNGINNVSIDDEMVELAKTQLDFAIASKLMNGRFTRLRSAIRGRR